MIIGHEKNIKILEKTFKEGKLPHAFLFWGPEGLGKYTIALEFAKSLICEKNEFFGCGECNMCQSENAVYKDHVITNEWFVEDGEKNSIGIDDILKIQDKIRLSTFSGKPRIVVIDQAEKLTLEAANRLLKTLEEPPPNTYFILITSAKESLISTILSRTIPLRFSFVSHQILEQFIKERYPKFSEDERRSLARFAGGRPGQLMEGLEDSDKIKEAQKKYSTAFNLIANPLYASLQKIEEIADAKEAIEEYIEYLIPTLRSLFFASYNIDHRNRLKTPDTLVQQFRDKYHPLNYITIMYHLLEIHRTTKETNINKRMALEGFLLEL